MRTLAGFAVLTVLLVSGCYFPNNGSGSAPSGSTGGRTEGGPDAGPSGTTTGTNGLGLCSPCGSSAECQSGFCDVNTRRCQLTRPCTEAPGACEAGGTRCDAASGNCACQGATTTGSSGSSGAAGSSGTTSGCSPGQTMCGQCVDLQTDPNNCGACGKPCPTGSCVAGQCSCPSGQEMCDFRCINTQTDPRNCGSCNNSCTPPMNSCVAGQCACSTGTTLCGANCVDTLNDSSNCGGCGQFCGSGARCANGHCACFSSSDLLCGNSCYSTNDPNNCGSCGNSCGAGFCQNGQCTCAGGQTRCGSTCANLQSDSANCGACGHSCGSGACQSGKCQPAPIITGQYFPTLVAVTDSYVFFADRNNNVQRAAKDGTGAAPFASGLGAVSKIVGVGGTVLFQAGADVYAAPEGQAPSTPATPVLASGTFDAWAADASGLYWSVAGSGCTCTGGASATYACSPDYNFACSTTCTCPTLGSINRADLDGSNPQLLVSDVGASGADALAVGLGHVYWVRLAGVYSGCPTSGGPSYSAELMRVPLAGGASQQIGTWTSGYNTAFTLGYGVFLGPNNAYVRGMALVGGCNTITDGWNWITATGGSANPEANAALRDLVTANGQVYAATNNGLITFPDNAPTGGTTQVFTSASSSGKVSLATDGTALYFADDSNGTLYRLAL